MALRSGLLRGAALQNDGHIKPAILQCQTLQETNLKGHWGPNFFLRISPLNIFVDLLAASWMTAETCFPHQCAAGVHAVT